MAGNSPARTGETDTFVSSTVKKEPTRMQSFMNFLYDKQTGRVLGRSGKSWLQITIFYLIFYGVLAAFFAVLLVLFLQTLDPNQPKWQNEHSLIGNNPGMGFRPTPPDSGSTLIWLKTSTSGNDARNENTTTGKYVKGMDDFLRTYEPGLQPKDAEMMKCGQGVRPQKDEKKVCQFLVSDLAPCTSDNAYGYTHGQPCVLLKLNRVFGWQPDLYNKSEIPQELKDFYRRNYNQTLENTYQTDQMYVSCDGEDAVDKESIGPIDLHPKTMPAYYFPYTNSPGYMSPLVMVEFLNPKPGMLINVECKAWAKNIKHSRTDRLGTVHFELLVDR